jgi:hypothetical protein
MAAQLPDIIGAHCRVQTANMWPIRGLGEGLRYMIINRKLTPDVDRAIRDALQGAEDVTEDEHALPLNQQGMWELAYMQGRCAPVLCDGEYLKVWDNNIRGLYQPSFFMSAYIRSVIWALMLFPIFSARCFIFSFSPAFTVISSRSYVFELYFLFALVADVPMLSPPQ